MAKRKCKVTRRRSQSGRETTMEALESRQLLSGVTGSQSKVADLRQAAFSAIETALTTRAGAAPHVATHHAPHVSAAQRLAALIAKEITTFQTNLHAEIRQHPHKLTNAKFQQTIENQQTAFAKRIAKQGGTYTPIPFDALIIGVGSAAPTTISAPTLGGASTSSSSLTLTWSAISGASSYKLETSTNGGKTWAVLANPTATTYVNTGLVADTGYSYRVSTIKSGASSAPSSTYALKTLLNPPGGFAALAKSPTEIDLAWVAVTDATNYKIERSTDNRTWSALTLSPALSTGSSAYADTSALAGTSYYYRISAIDAAGTSSPTTGIAAQTVTTTPTIATASVISATEIDLKWNAVTGATAYKLEVSLDGGTTWSTVASPTSTAYASTGLAADTSYTYRVSGVDATGQSTPSGTINATTILLPPASLAALPASSTTANLTWSLVADATGYIIQSSPDQKAWTALKPANPLTGGINSYTDTSASAGKIVYYRIAAVDASGTSAYSTSTVSVLTVPAQPTLAASLASVSEIDLKWGVITGATGYLLEISPDGNAWSTLSSATGTSYANTALTADTTYFYRVTAIDATGDSAASAPVSKTTPLGVLSNLVGIPSPTSPTEIDLTWNAAQDATAYKLERSPDNKTWATIASPTGGMTSYPDTGVAAGTKYYYRISAINAVGTSTPLVIQSPVQTIPVTPTLAASVASATEIDLKWNTVTGATGYVLQTTTDGGNTWRAISTQTSTSFANTGLTADTSYSYRILATDTGGSSAPSMPGSFTTILPAPTSLVATPNGAAEVDLTWNPVVDATSYSIQRSTDQKTWSPLTLSPALSGGGATAYADTSALAGTAYYYRISAVNAVGASAPSAVSNSALTNPAATPTVTATVATAAEIDLTWTAVTGATGYRVEDSADGGMTWTTSGTATKTALAVTALTADTQYKFRVTSLDATGPSIPSTPIVKTTILPPPATPTVAAVIAQAQNGSTGAPAVLVTWNPVTDATGYKVERSTDQKTWSVLTGTPAMNNGSLTFLDTTSAAGTKYYYGVAAVNAVGTSAIASSAQILTDPAAPTVSASIISATEVDLKWGPSTTATSYQILDSTNRGVTWNSLATQSATSYAATGLSADTSYQFEVVAINASGPSAPGAITQTTILPAPASLAITASSATQINLVWSPVTDATTYTIEKSADGTTWAAIKPATAPTGSTTTYSDTALTAGKAYYYRVRAVDASGTSAATTAQHTLTLPVAPTVAASVISATQVNLTWNAPTSATGYIVLESANGGTTWTTAALPTTTAFSATGLTPDTAYKFTVTAIDSGGDSLASAVASATTFLPMPANFTVSAQSTGAVALSWSAVTDATSYTIQRSTDNATWTALAPNPALTGTSDAYNDTTAAAGTSYYYRIFDADSASTSAITPSQNVLTYPASPTITAAPASSTQINLTWTPSFGATSYLLEQSIGDNSHYMTLATPSGAATAYAATGLTAYTEYYYRITARNATGSSQVSLYTLQYTDPAAPNITAIPASATEVDITWTAVTGATLYYIERSLDQKTWTNVQPPYPGASDTIYRDTNVQGGTTYYYRITADNPFSDSAPSTPTNALTYPAAPTLAATATSATQVNLTWHAVAGATAYDIAYTSGNNSAVTAGPVTGTSFAVTGLSADTQYAFVIEAVDATGNSAISNTAQAATFLAAPATLTATEASGTEIDLAWSTVTDATTYVIQRSTNQTTWSTLQPGTALTGSSTAFADTTAAAGTNYYYRIAGVDTASTSAYTGASAMTVPAAPTVTAASTSAGQINVTWTPVTGATSYIVVNNSNATLATQPNTNLVVTGLTADTAYTYTVVGVDAAGMGPNGSASATTWLGAPASFAASAASAAEIDLTWSHVTDATNYAIQRSPDGNVWSTLIPGTALTGASTAFADTTVSAGTTYYYRINAINSKGPSIWTGAQHALTKPAAPTLTATVASATEVDLTWSLVKSATSYYAEYKASGGSSYTREPAQPGGTFAVTGLSADTAYVFQAVASNATGDSAVGAGQTLTTLPVPPTGVSATAASITEIDLAWTANTNATGYVILRSTDQKTWSALTQSTPLMGTDTAFADTTASAGTTYYYRIETVDANGTSAGAPASALTFPAAPTLTATPVSATTAKLTWTAAASATSYLLEDEISSTWGTVATVNGTSYTDTALAAATTYPFRVTAINATGHSAASGTASVTTLLAPPPTVTATAASATEIDLVWSAVTGATTFTILRSLDQNTWTAVTPSSPLTSSSTAYADTSALAGTTYYYKIEAVNSEGPSVPSAPAHALSDPAAPTVAAKVVSATSVSITWNSVPTATSYIVQNSATGSSPWTNVGTPSGVALVDTTATAGTTYTYRVIAVNASGNSAAGAASPVTTLLPAPTLHVTPASPTEADLAWADITGATTYLIERSPDQINWTSLAPSPALGTTATAYNDTSASAGTTYYYRISAIDGTNNSAPSTVVSALTMPATPTLTATPQLDSEIDLSWTPVATATSYLLEMKTGSTWSTLQTQGTATTFAATGLTADTTYGFRITAINASGNGATSTPVLNATTLIDPPATVTATAASTSEIDLTWTRVTDATNYQIEQSTDQQAWNILNTTLTGSSTAYADTSVWSGTNYYYRIEAINSNGISTSSTVVSVTTPNITNSTFKIVPTFTSSVTSLSNAAQVESAFNYAISQYENYISTPITVNITVVAAPGTNILGQSQVSANYYSYSSIRTALLANNANLVIPATDPTGNSSSWILPPSEAKALGLMSASSASDGTFTFGTGFNYSFDPNNRAVANDYDFIGVAEHEISEIMGRIPGGLTQKVYTPFDLFRFTAANTRSFSQTATGVYFSLDSGTTNLMSDNSVPGADVQDWASGQSDSYNAFGNPGSEDDISDVDLKAMNSIGYGLNVQTGGFKSRAVWTGAPLIIGAEM